RLAADFVAPQAVGLEGCGNGLRQAEVGEVLRDQRRQWHRAVRRSEAEALGNVAVNGRLRARVPVDCKARRGRLGAAVDQRRRWPTCIEQVALAREVL